MNYKMVLGGSLMVAGATMLLTSLKTKPLGAPVVKPFDVQRYTGKWYEIARFDYKYERNLTNTTADYSLNEDGTLKVVNRGYNLAKGKWEVVTGRAKFVGDEDEAKLKVSFFGPFYSGYNVIAIDPDYRYALVAGKNRDYLWILSRETSMPQHVKEDYLMTAREIGYDTADLIWVDHESAGISKGV